MSIAVGVILIGVSVLSLWFMLPAGGQVKPLATMPVVEVMIPMGITAGIFVGAGLILASLLF